MNDCRIRSSKLILMMLIIALIYFLCVWHSQVFIEDVPQVIEQVRTVPTYRQATPSANRQALLANVNYKSRGPSSAQILDDEEDDQKVGTIRNYSHINEDGSFTFGYEAADGSFKEETRGIDCVVRGKYG